MIKAIWEINSLTLHALLFTRFVSKSASVFSTFDHIVPTIYRQSAQKDVTIFKVIFLIRWKFS